MTLRHLQRKSILGIDPRLILVFELGAPMEADDFRRAGLQVVDTSVSRVTIAFADDPQLTAFNERLTAMQGQLPAGQKHEPYAQFFDAIDHIRAFGAQDRLTQDARTAVETADPTALIRLDVECWHPGQRDLAAEWLAELRLAVEKAKGQVASFMINDAILLVLARVYLPAGKIAELSELDVIARIDVLPTPALSTPQLFNLQASDLPEMHSPAPNAPIVGIIDSGVASAHELLAGAILAAEPVGTGIVDGQDEHGHGTMVASIVLHGDVETAVAQGLPLRPLCYIVSARVLDRHNSFPEQDLWEEDLARSIEWCAGQGATIINLSLGDSRAPFTPPRQMTAAAVVDDLARRLGLVIIAATGNSKPVDYLPGLDEESIGTYPEALLNHDRTNILDPGTALLAITVGGLTTAVAAGGQSGFETPTRRPIGEPQWPSPITRTGPGPASAVKPELVDRSGTLGLEGGRLVSNDAELGVIGAKAGSGRLLAWDVGTSYSTPIVTRIAAAVRARFPEFSAELVRSLVLLSANRVAFADRFDGTLAAKLVAEQRLLGYGQPSLHRAIESTTHRVVLVADASIPINGVHIYDVPLPSSFLQSGGHRGIDIAMAFSPATRVRRLDYAASRMEFHLVKGMPTEKIQEVFVRLSGQDLEANDVIPVEEQRADDQNAETDAESQPPVPSELGSALVNMTPSTAVRSRGANQLGRKIFKQRLQEDRDSPLHLVVRNVNRWADPEIMQPYALSVALWRDDNQPELHAELEAQLEAVIEVPIELEIGV